MTVETISDMFGYFEFRICPYNDDQSVTKECLNKNILEIGDTGYTRYKVWYQGYHVIPLQLPADLKCDKCLLQFQYHTGKKNIPLSALFLCCHKNILSDKPLYSRM